MALPPRGAPSQAPGTIRPSACHQLGSWKFSLPHSLFLSRQEKPCLLSQGKGTNQGLGFLKSFQFKCVCCLGHGVYLETCFGRCLYLHRSAPEATCCLSGPLKTLGCLLQPQVLPGEPGHSTILGTQRTLEGWFYLAGA